MGIKIPHVKNMVPPGQETSCFPTLRESRDWEWDLQGHGEKAQISFSHITSVATGPLHMATLSHVPEARSLPMPYSPRSWPQLWLYSDFRQSQAQDLSDTALDRALGARLTPYIISLRTCSRSGDTFGKGE